MLPSIRPYRPEDQDAVVAIFTNWNHEIAPPGQEAAFENYIRRSLDEEILRIPAYYQERPGSGFWIAGIEGRVTGMVGIERLSAAKAEVRRMYVDAAFRRQGIGSQLLDHAEAFCRESGYACILLSTSELQAAAKELYKARGYRLEKTIVAQEQSNRTVGGGIRRYHFVKVLAERENSLL